MSKLTQSNPTVREIKYLRISLTDACNFRCSYCKSGEVYKPSRDLTKEEITLVVRVFSTYGLQTVRFTGGEPLLRNDIVDIVSSVRDYVEDITLTTNGYFLKEFAKPLKEAGLKRLNVSLDSLNEDKFRSLTGGELNKVLDGLEESKKYFTGIKINTVAIKGFTEEEIDPLLEICKENDFHLRFIELMPVGNLPFFKEDRFLPLDWIKNYIEERYGELFPLDRSGSGASKDFYIPALGVKVGFIKSITEPFCEGCQKFRITADGKLHFCLRTDNEFDLKPYLQSEEQLHLVVPKLLELKQINNEFITKEGFKWFSVERSMVKIGG
jgi:cyclic pyranopterin phosphate synthase